MKNRYPLSRKRKFASYSLEAYIYFPAQLGITESRYGVEQFFADVKSHTRFSISYIPLDKLVDPSCEVSPLNRINRYLDEAALASELNEQRILYELRTLASLYSAEMKATYRLLRKISSEENPEVLEDKAESFLTDTQEFLKAFRKLHPRFIDPSVPEQMNTALKWADESISLSTENMLYYLHQYFSDHSLIETIKTMLEREKQHRAASGYPSFLKEGDPAEIERSLYRKSILKKWAQTVLYMSREETKTRNGIGHLVGGLAAAIAMSFAIVATFFADNLFASYSVPWALIVVVSYILKDRIKEILRGALVRILPRLVSDRSERLIDQATKKRVGKTKSMVRMIRPKDVPAGIKALRASGSNPFKSILPEENVIHFRKDIRINNRKLFREHTRMEAITEIIRIKLDRFLEEMDTSGKYLRTWMDGDAKALKGNRVYHVNMLLALSQDRAPGEEELFRYRLVLNRNGIRRIEKVQ